ncbi:MAG TPA: MFS transporter [Pseudonocardiaceae bacterium]
MTTPAVSEPQHRSEQADHEPGHPRRWAVLGICVVCLLVVWMDSTILNVALKTIQEDLNATQADMQWAMSSYTLIFAGLTLSFGLVGDRYGRKPVLLVGLAVFGLGSALSAWADSPIQLIMARGVMGIGSATVFPITLSIITNVFPAGQRAKAVGVWSAAGGVGAAIGPLVGGYLLGHWWWGSIFLVNVPLVAACLLAIWLVVPDSRDPKPGRVDILGVALSVLGIVAVVYGIIRAGDQADWTRPEVLGALLGGLLVLAIFALVERHSDHPALDVTFFRQGAFTAGATSVAIAFFALMGLSFALSYYLQGVRGDSPLLAGVLLVPGAIGIALGSVAAPLLTRHLSIRLTTTAGMVLLAAANLAFLSIGRDTTAWVYEPLILLSGVGTGLALTAPTESMMSVVPRERAGEGSAVNSALRNIGGALGVAVLGALLAGSYRAHLGDAASVLPAQYREQASGSIAGTLGAVERVTAAGRLAIGQGQLSMAQALRLRSQLTDLVGRACDAYVSAFHVALFCGAMVVLLGAVVALVWLPGRHRPFRETLRETP